MFDSERNKQHQSVLCNEIRRLTNETIKQSAVRIKTLVRKAYSLIKHDYKNTKVTEILMNTSIKENSYKKESISSFFNSRTRFRFQKISR